MLKLYVLKDPRSGNVEQVYEYPEDLVSPAYRWSTCKLVTRDPFKLPILMVPNEYLTEMDGQGVITDPTYMSLEFIDYFLDDTKKQAKQSQYDDRLTKVKDIFAMGSSHKRTCKTIFFTGPKAVYKKTFTDNWICLPTGTLLLTNHGRFDTIDSLSVKGLNEVFITGTFAAGDIGQDVMENTQCKIIVGVN